MARRKQRTALQNEVEKFCPCHRIPVLRIGMGHSVNVLAILKGCRRPGDIRCGWDLRRSVKGGDNLASVRLVQDGIGKGSDVVEDGSGEAGRGRPVHHDALRAPGGYQVGDRRVDVLGGNDERTAPVTLGTQNKVDALNGDGGILVGDLVRVDRPRDGDLVAQHQTVEQTKRLQAIRRGLRHHAHVDDVGARRKRRARRQQLGGRRQHEHRGTEKRATPSDGSIRWMFRVVHCRCWFIAARGGFAPTTEIGASSSLPCGP